MNTCKEFHILIEKFISEEILPEEKSRLQKHIESCKDCAKLFETNIVLTKSELPFEKADQSEFNIMRRKVIESIHTKDQKSFSARFGKFIDSILVSINKPEYAIAAVTLIVGFFLGRALPPDENGVTGGILKQISSIAEQNTYFSDTQKSAYRFTNVSMKEIDQNKIEMSFDVSTSLEIVSEKSDPLVKEILTQTMMEPENVGSNLRAISYSETITDKKIKQALIYSMHNAPIAAVRLKSMESLMKYKMDAELQEAFIKILLEEDTIQMNLMAIDYLTKNNYNADSLKTIIDEVNPQKSTAIFIRAKKNKKNNL